MFSNNEFAPESQFLDLMTRGQCTFDGFTLKILFPNGFVSVRPLVLRKLFGRVTDLNNTQKCRICTNSNQADLVLTLSKIYTGPEVSRHDVKK